MSLVNLIKEVGVSAVNAGMPTSFIFGTVTKVDPIEITTEQKLKIPKEFIILSKNVTDYEIEISLDIDTNLESGGSGYAEFSSHSHKIAGKKKIKVLNALKFGEKVIMARVQGGQDFIVLDRSSK